MNNTKGMNSNYFCTKTLNQVEKSEVRYTAEFNLDTHDQKDHNFMKTHSEITATLSTNMQN